MVVAVMAVAAAARLEAVLVLVWVWHDARDELGRVVALVGRQVRDKLLAVAHCGPFNIGAGRHGTGGA